MWRMVLSGLLRVCVGPNLDSSRCLLWDELAGLYSCWDTPWCFGGDFNTTQFPNDHLGESHFTSAMADFSDFIFVRDLIDFTFIGGDFMWSNGQS